MLDPERPRRLDRGLQEVRLAVMGDSHAGRADEEGAGGPHQGLAGLGLEVAPDFVSAKGERDVVQALADGPTGDAGLAVAGPLVVRWTMGIQPQHPRPAPCRLKSRGRAHGPQADNDQIVGLHPSRLSRLALPPAEVVSTVQVRSTQNLGR